MKIKQLKLKNINSFVGEFEIDFEKFNDLFLITGATGSGKSTIIDAICAVLYNKTPRLSNASHLLNKNEKEGFIELIFEIENQIYKVTWNIKRKKNNKLNSPKRELFRGDEFISDKKIEEEIKNILKLDFKQFTKAIVLAQGEFDAFLSAGAKEKSVILETILDIKEYEKISIKIYQKTKETKTYLQNLIDELENLEFEDTNLLENELKTQQNQLVFLKQKEDDLDKNIALLNEKNRLKKEIIRLKDDLNSINIENLETTFNTKQTEYKKFKQQKQEFFEFYDKEIEKITQSINILSQLKDKENFYDTQKTTLLNKQSKLQKLKIELSKKQDELNSLVLEDVENFDEIENNFNLYQESLKNYKKTLQQKEDYINQLNKDKTKLETLKNEFNQLKEKIEYLKAKTKVLEYEKARKELIPNTPCPLCGSLTHPYIQTPPNIDETIKQQYQTTKNKIESIEKEISKLEIIIKEKEKNPIKIDETYKTLKEISKDEFEKLKHKKEIYNQNLTTQKLLKNDIKNLETNIKDLEEEISKIDLDILQKEIQKLKSKEIYQNPIEKKEELVAKKEKFENSTLEDEVLSLEKEIIRLKEKKETLQNALIQAEKKFEEIKIENKDYLGLQKQNREQIEELIKIIENQKQKIKENIKIENRYETLNKQIKTLQKEYHLLEKLNSKIGSAQGDKFKQIAINFMIDGLLFNTNQNLKKLTNDRYILEKSDEKLEFLIVDKFYENTKRDVSTLSGGEKFLVSLALAFGLSDLIKDKINLETLFLDEGFGSLDNETLQNALSILKEVSLEKSIGIISHIDTMKEEISKQIVIKKLPQGRSKILIKT